MLPGCCGGRLPGRSTKEKGREEGEPGEDSEERKIRNEIAQKVVAGIKEKASAHDDDKATALRAAGQSVKQNWDRSKSKTKKRRPRERIRRQGSNTSTQPQTSSSQWQGWCGWKDWTNSSSSSNRW